MLSSLCPSTEKYTVCAYLHGTALLLNGKLNAHLEEIDRAANEMLELLVDQHAAREGVTERLKAENQMEWVRRMNDIRAQVEEIIYLELIYG